MKTLLFERRTGVYLPEIAAYCTYIKERLPGVQAFDSADLQEGNSGDFDIIWRFMGMDRQGAPGRFMVHEYNSLSAGRFPRLKNWMKTRLNARPQRRVFLNQDVRKGFTFGDDIPARLRDMGVDKRFYGAALKPEYDFVYAGSMSRGREVVRLLEKFSGNLKDATILIVGTPPAGVKDKFGRRGNITFTGRVPYHEVPALMAKGRYGLNLVPDRYPFNLQPATKVLEYCAIGLPVVSMRYGWATGFMTQRSGTCFWLSPDFGNLSLKNLENFAFHTPSVEDLEWSRVIADSGVFDFLEQA